MFITPALAQHNIPYSGGDMYEYVRGLGQSTFQAFDRRPSGGQTSNTGTTAGKLVLPKKLTLLGKTVSPVNLPATEPTWLVNFRKGCSGNVQTVDPKTFTAAKYGNVDAALRALTALRSRLSTTCRVSPVKLNGTEVFCCPRSEATGNVGKIVDVGGKAQGQSLAADAAAKRIKDLEAALASLQSTVDSAKQGGAPSAEVQGLQKQVADLTAALSAAQQEHIAAASAAADLHREEMGMLQLQIAELASALSSAQGGAAAGDGAAAGQVAELQAQILMLQEQLAAAGQAAVAEDQAAAETAATANGGDFFTQHRNALLLGAAAVIVAGAAYWFFLRRKPAAGLPAPMSASSPSGLAANPERQQYVRSYSYKHPKTGKTVYVKRHRRAPAQKKMTKAQMKDKGWVYDIYTGEPLVKQDVRTDYGPRYSGSGTLDLPAAMPGDVKMIVRTMASSAKRYGGHLGEDDSSVYWAQWDDGTWIVGDNADRIKDSLIKTPDGEWYWKAWRGLTRSGKRTRLTQSQAKREAAKYFRDISEYVGW